MSSLDVAGLLGLISSVGVAGSGDVKTRSKAMKKNVFFFRYS